ncbi:pyruvate, phosphate dikinase [Achromobacter sp. KAs 3-5]|nr:pyruvate, phosphate dikinase [Achromobacter sp. KAs 3-5]
MILARAPLRPLIPLRMSLAVLAVSALLVGAGASPAQAQTARKPSPYENGRPLRPDEVEARKAEDARWGGPRFLAQIKTRAEFDQLARVYNAGTPLEIPHVLFVIDRQRADRIYYVNTPRYGLHETFARERRLLSGDRAALVAQYKDPNRRLLFGTLSWQNSLPGYTYEFWEGDLLTPELLTLTAQRLSATFPLPLKFKSNSTLQEETARRAGLDFVTQEALLREQTFLPLNTGRAQGRLRIVKAVDETADLSPTDIVVLDEVPVALTPVAGLVTQRPSTLLSHVNLLAKGWRIPNAYVRDAAAALREHDGQWVELTVESNGYRVRRIAQPAASTASAATPASSPSLPQRADFASDANVRRAELAKLRQDIVDATPDPALSAAWRARWEKQLGGHGVFVRSSSNSEDLPGFSGAGLYTTVPNVTQADALARAVQTVWASVYNFEAYEARRTAGFGQDAVVMAVLVQRAAASDSSGVMITRDPFDASRRHVTYLSAKRGLGIKVVEGKRQAEQVMYSSWSKAVQVLSRSAEDTQLVADAGGGVREVPLEGARQVLNDALVARLAAVGRQVKKRLGNGDQDIEWAVQADKILILQARPYVDGSR